MEAAKHTVERKSLEQREKMSELERLRHSAAHIMAAAVLRIWPDAMLDIGPATEDGFYYDFDLPSHRFTPDDFPKIEEEMRKIVKENHRFEKIVKTREEAKAFLEQLGQKYKIDRLNDIPEGEPISFYQSGEFMIYAPDRTLCGQAMLRHLSYYDSHRHTIAAMKKTRNYNEFTAPLSLQKPSLKIG
jgi:threonyl-tRNA synthetase